MVGDPDPAGSVWSSRSIPVHNDLDPLPVFFKSIPDPFIVFTESYRQKFKKIFKLFVYEYRYLLAFFILGFQRF